MKQTPSKCMTDKYTVHYLKDKGCLFEQMGFSPKDCVIHVHVPAGLSE